MAAEALLRLGEDGVCFRRLLVVHDQHLHVRAQRVVRRELLEDRDLHVESRRFGDLGQASWPHRSLPWALSGSAARLRVHSAARSWESPPQEFRAVSCGPTKTGTLTMLRGERAQQVLGVVLASDGHDGHPQPDARRAVRTRSYPRGLCRTALHCRRHHQII